MEIIINEFAQGGFWVYSYSEYDSSTEIRSGWIDIGYAYKITVQTDKQWSFVCADVNGNFQKISESLDYKNGGYVVDLIAYPWIRYIRIELHDTNGISPPQSCILQELTTWKIGEDGFPTNIDFIDLPESPMEKPYPKAVWRIEPGVNDEFPFNELLPLEKPSGAFMNAHDLEYACIPRSCKKIGKLAFTNTKLRRVKISEDCEYYPTSFPPDCEIKYYEGGGEYGQLLDSEGYAVIDADGAKIYVKE